jgi:hypothetical protein
VRPLEAGGGCGFAVDATLYLRSDAECSPGREQVHHDACRCDATRKTIPGWEYQFTAAIGHLRTAWAGLIDVERTTQATCTWQTVWQVKNLLRRLHAAGNGGAGAPLVIFDAGYSAAALTAVLADCPVHLLIRLPAGSVFYHGAITWPASKAVPACAARGWPATRPATRTSPIPSPTSPSSCRAPRGTAPSAWMPGGECTP